MKLCAKTILLVATCGVLCVGNTPAQEVFQERGGIYSTEELSAAMAITGSRKLTIESVSTLTGTLTIYASSSDEVSLTYRKQAKAESRSRAIDYIDLIAVDLHQVATGVRLQMRAPNPAVWSASEAGLVEAELIVPRGVSLYVEALYFDVEVQGPFERVVVPSSLGRLKVAHVDKELELSTKNRRVTIEDISGEIFVATSNATLEARDIRSKGQQAVFRNEGGDVEIEGLAGEVSIKNNFGRVELTGYSPIGDRNVIRSRSGPVLVDIAEISGGQVIINNRFEDIDITIPDQASTVLTLVVAENDKIEVSGLEFQTDLVERNRLSLIAGDGDAVIRCSTHGSGNIYVRGIEQE